MTQKQGEKERNIYEDLLRGKNIAGTYKNTNLYLVGKNNARTVEERTEHKIAPPANLNQFYSQPPSTKQLVKKKRTSHLVDPAILRRFRE